MNIRKLPLFLSLLVLFFLTGYAICPATEIAAEGLSVSLNDQDGSLIITSAPKKIVFRTEPAADLHFQDLQTDQKTLTANMIAKGSPDPILFTMEILNDHEISLSFQGSGKMSLPVSWPPPFVQEPNDSVLLPIGSGVIWPANLPNGEDPQYLSMKESLFWTRNLTMGFWSVLRGDAWLDLIPEDASDAALSALRDPQGRLSCRFLWHSENGEWGYRRTMRLILGDSGGITAACKAYRKYRIPFGFGKTLLEKAKQAPQIKNIAGAANIWLWHDHCAELMYERTTEKIDVDNTSAIEKIAEDFHQAGIDRVLWGIFFIKDAPKVKDLRKYGWLVSKYDNFTDVMPPELQKVIPAHRIENCDYTVRRNKNWPQDILVQPNGSLAKCWALYGIDGKKYNQNALCPRQAESDIRAEVPGIAQKWGFNAWFIDVMGGSLRQCFSKDHPMTRRESRQYQLYNFQALLDSGLVSGTEEGVECFLPALCYTEGKMSVFPYRIDPHMCWRWKSESFSDPEKALYLDRYMLNPKYRVPIWDLVWHECSVNYWYWGDASNNVPARLKRRDLFNALYGTPPMYSFKTKDWNAPFPADAKSGSDPEKSTLKDLILASYRRAAPVARKTAFSKMLSFEWITEDRLIQRTVFADGTVVTANFSDQLFTVNGSMIPPGDYIITQKSFH
ncbi:MAG: glycoside hydrolase [Planctomycetia bacterium]|nr:glycoside hydrolase [Planctomycetia bacterium]